MQAELPSDVQRLYRGPRLLPARWLPAQRPKMMASCLRTSFGPGNAAWRCTTNSGFGLKSERHRRKAAMESKFWETYRGACDAHQRRWFVNSFSGFPSERPSATVVLERAINAALEALAHRSRRSSALELTYRALPRFQ
jgi:hypothetical protein